MISSDQLSHLQKLAAISLSSEQEQKFVDDLGSIILELEKLQNISVSDADDRQASSMPIRRGVVDTVDGKELLDNVQHPLINNSPVIKSALDT